MLNILGHFVQRKQKWGCMLQEQKPGPRHPWNPKVQTICGSGNLSHGKLNLYNHISHLASHWAKNAFSNHCDFPFLLHKIHQRSKQTISISLSPCPWRPVWRLHVFSTGAVKSAIPLPASHFICAGMQRSGVRPLLRCWIVRLMIAILRDRVRRVKLSPAQTGVLCFALPLLLKCWVFIWMKRKNGN